MRISDYSYNYHKTSYSWYINNYNGWKALCQYAIILSMEKKKILIEFGKNLRAERNRAGLSQDALAEKMGICAGKHIGTIERGETNPSLTTIIAILQALDISFDKLFVYKK